MFALDVYSANNFVNTIQNESDSLFPSSCVQGEKDMLRSSVLQRVAACCSVLQCVAVGVVVCVAVCIAVCVAVCCSLLQLLFVSQERRSCCAAVCCSMLQCVAACCTVCCRVCCSITCYSSVSCSVLQSVLQCVSQCVLRYVLPCVLLCVAVCGMGWLRLVASFKL